MIQIAGLTSCRHCHQESSKFALFCPHCGGYSPGVAHRIFVLLATLAIAILCFFFIRFIGDYYNMGKELKSIHMFKKTF